VHSLVYGPFFICSYSEDRVITKFIHTEHHKFTILLWYYWKLSVVKR